VNLITRIKDRIRDYLEARDREHPDTEILDASGPGDQ
jgi:hypothetical protein